MDRARRFREAAAQLNQARDRTGWRYSAPLRQLAVDHCRQRRLAHVSFAEIAAELGISTVTLGRWLEQGDAVSSPGFREVVVEGLASAGGSTLAVVTPTGLRIEGLVFEQVLELTRGWR
ncbi:MAG: hypothetical protein HC834_04770 [Rhodospirillales bacterium]|nr:hypothetical protein [Rhodospirillales bacterium]